MKKVHHFATPSCVSDVLYELFGSMARMHIVLTLPGSDGRLSMVCSGSVKR